MDGWMNSEEELYIYSCPVNGDIIVGPNYQVARFVSLRRTVQLCNRHGSKQSDLSMSCAVTRPSFRLPHIESRNKSAEHLAICVIQSALFKTILFGILSDKFHISLS